jgi:type IV secretion system protein VirD4
MIHNVQATDLAAAPAGGQPLRGPGIATMLSHAGDLVWNISGFMPAGHLGALGVLAAAGGGGYLKIRSDRARGPLVKKSDRVGFADKREIRTFLSADSLRQRALTLRPSLHGVPVREIHPLAVGRLIGKDVIYKEAVYATVEDMCLLFAPPRSGKSAFLAGQIIDAPGADVVTSTRGDLYEHTAGLRARRGTVDVFNSDVSGIRNTIRWNVVKGCRDPRIAFRRAGYLLAGQASGGVEDSSFWNGQSYRVLRTLLMAADLGGRTLMDVRAWIADPSDTDPIEIMDGHRREIPPGWYEDLRLVMESPERTRASVLMTAITALECLALPQVADIITPRPGDHQFDPVLFLRTSGTLYLMGRHRDNGSIAPLVACLVGEIYETAKELAADSAGGRLDPPLALDLDEAAIIAPLPIQSWGADAGGSGITLTVSVQSPSQLYDRWGHNGGRTIWQLANKLVLGGLSVMEDLEALSQLCGERDEKVENPSVSPKGERSVQTSTRRVRVLPPDRIRRLKQWTALYLHRSTSPVVVSFVPVWKRPDVKAYAAELKRQGTNTGVVFDKVPTTPPMPAYKPGIPSQPADAPAVEPSRRKAG